MATLAGGYARRVADTVLIHTNTVLALKVACSAPARGPEDTATGETALVKLRAAKLKTFDVTCPCCGARLRVDPEVRAVVSHEPPPKPQQVSDLTQAARTLREKESRREEQFQKSFKAERDRSKLLDRKFEEALQKALRMLEILKQHWMQPNEAGEQLVPADRKPR